VLSSEGLVKRNVYTSKGVEYHYFTEALTFNDIHQAALLGPRYSKNDGRFYSFDVIDLFGHRVCVESQRTKDDRPLADSPMRCRKTVGMPAHQIVLLQFAVFLVKIPPKNVYGIIPESLCRSEP
jgi:hypothetical protein